MDKFEDIHLFGFWLFITNHVITHLRKRKNTMKSSEYFFLVGNQIKRLGRGWLMNFKKSSWICKYACLAQIVETPPQTSCYIMHFDTVAWEGVNELQSLSRMFDQKEKVTLVPTLMHKNGLKEINVTVSSLQKDFTDHSMSADFTEQIIQRSEPNLRKKE